MRAPRLDRPPAPCTRWHRRLRAPLAAFLALALAGCSPTAADGTRAGRTPRGPSAPSRPGAPGVTVLDAEALRRQLREHGLGRVAEALAELARPALRLRHRKGAEPGAPTTRLGGLPDLAPGVEWPEWRAKPLAFLCQLRLEELPGTGIAELPRAGLVSFFHVADQSTCGDDPGDLGSFRVLFAADAAACMERARPAGLAAASVFRTVPLAAEPTLSLPSPRHPDVAGLRLDEVEREQLGELHFDLMHQVGGHPQPIQNDDMPDACERVAAALGFAAPRGLDGRPSEPWLLLLQLDSDGDMLWGDAGCLWFWIRRDDLAARRFDRVWMILQCS